MGKSKLSINNEDRLKILHKKMVEDIVYYGIILLDLDGTILTWNKGAEKNKRL